MQTGCEPEIWIDLDDGTSCLVCEMFGEGGEQVTDADEAWLFIVAMPDGRLCAVERADDDEGDEYEGAMLQ